MMGACAVVWFSPSPVPTAPESWPVTGFIASHGGWVVEAAQHGDLTTGRFFQRIEILADSLPFGPDEFGGRFVEVADEFGLDWHLSDTDDVKRVVVLVSRRTTAWPTCCTGGAPATSAATSPR